MTLPEWFEYSEKMYRRQAEWVVKTIREHCEGAVCEPRHLTMFMEILHGSVKWLDKAPPEVATPEEQANYLAAQDAGFKGEHEIYKRQSRAVILGWYERELREMCRVK